MIVIAYLTKYLFNDCRELVKKSKILQKEIVAERGGDGDEKEFYKKNSRLVFEILLGYNLLISNKGHIRRNKQTWPKRGWGRGAKRIAYP